MENVKIGVHFPEGEPHTGKVKKNRGKGLHRFEKKKEKLGGVKQKEGPADAKLEDLWSSTDMAISKTGVAWN